MFLPIDISELPKRGWNEVDFVIITGDAYVDHHSFGTAIIARLLERYGYKVGVLAQPDFHDTKDFKRFGKPRLGFLINSGTVDSMVNNYSVFKRKRRVDEYAPGGSFGKRPDRAVIVYSNRVREAYKGVPIIIGGIEASLRRFAHYDYWDDKIRRSILMDSRADLLIYGMGEKAVIEIAEALDSGISIEDITWIRGTCYKTKSKSSIHEYMELPGYMDVLNSKKEYAKSFLMQYNNNDHITGKILVEKYDESNYVVQNPPQEPLSTMELDDIYELPYENEYHPSYEKDGGIPAFKEVKFSIVSSRGCFGGCAFCAITYHQGRVVRGRSKESLVKEAKALTRKADFKGYINDVGGPTANFRSPACEKQLEYGVCINKDCLYPKPCKSMNIDHREYLDVLKSIREIDGIKKVFIRSGIRYDYLMADENYKEFLDELCKYHVSGILKVAPEHISNNVLKYMRKPPKEVFTKFVREYMKANERIGKKQYLIPYLISSHPGSTINDAIELAIFLKEWGFIPDQVQDFYPTPGTYATCMYYTEIDPFTMEKVYVAKSLDEKKRQRALLHFNKPYNKEIVTDTLKKANREDLIEYFYSKGKNYERNKGNRKRNRKGN